MRTIQEKVQTIKPTAVERGGGIYVDDHGDMMYWSSSWENAWAEIVDESFEAGRSRTSIQALANIYKNATKGRTLDAVGKGDTLLAIQQASLSALLAIYPEYLDVMDAEEESGG